jgi:hypothetical protein
MDHEGDTQPPDGGSGQEAFGGAFGDRCPSCGAPLASDQRYCIECGQRRGKPRFSASGQTAAAPKPKRERRRMPRPAGSSGATLVAGIATLLLAMGVGFEIGHGSKAPPTKTEAASAPEVITVGDGAGSGGTATTASSNRHKSSKKTKSSKAPKQTKVVVQKANDAAAKQLGTSTKNLDSNPTVKQGQSCSGGAGCQGGKFTGNFFGGG